MATTKFINDENLQSEFNIVASAPCSGPYDLSGIMADTIISHSLILTWVYCLFAYFISIGLWQYI